VAGDEADGPAGGPIDLARLNTGVPHPARIYDVWLGGKDNFAADRAAAAAALEAFPSAIRSIQANRAFLARAARYLVQEAGIRQILDIGTGLPSANNTHEVSQAIAPDTRVVYVDNDPIVLRHAEALLTSTKPGGTSYIDADLRNPAAILGEAARTLDFSRPIGVMLIAILHFIGPGDHPYEIVRTLMDAVPPGSYLAISHIASDILPEELAAFARSYNERSGKKLVLRDRDEVARFFDGLELADPGLTQISSWRPVSDLEVAAQATAWGGVARKPL
jgi:hypothetical protein